MGKAPSGSLPESVYASVHLRQFLFCRSNSSIYPPMLFIIFLGYSLTCVTYAGIVDLNADLMCLRRRDLDVLDCKILASLPRDSRL